MLELFANQRGLINLLLVFACAALIPINAISVVRRQKARFAVTNLAGTPLPQIPAIKASNEAGAIGVGVVWAALICVGPTLTQVWRGDGPVFPWLAALLYTNYWLSVSRVIVPDDRTHIAVAMTIRSVIYGVFFGMALAALNNW